MYFVDYVDDTPVGHSELCFNPNMMGHEEGMAPPFVGMTRTYDENDKESEGKSFRKMGLGKRRLIEMDAYARALYDRPLDSDSLLISDGIDEEGKRTSSIRRIWEGLVGEGKAEEYTDGHGNVRYRMK